MKRFGVPQTSSGGSCKKACAWVTVAEEHLNKAPECLLSIAAQEPPEGGDIVLTAWPDPDMLAKQVLPTWHVIAKINCWTNRGAFVPRGALCQ